MNREEHEVRKFAIALDWTCSIPIKDKLITFYNCPISDKSNVSKVFQSRKEWHHTYLHSLIKKRITPFWISVHVNSKTFMAWKFSTRFGTCYFVVMERVSTGSEFRASCPQWANSSWLDSRKRAPTSITIIVSDLSVNKDFRWTRRINRAEYKLCLEDVRCTFGSFESCFSFTFLPHATKLSPMSTR